MFDSFILDGKEYAPADLSENGQRLFRSYLTVERQLNEAQNMYAVLTKARQAYMADIKNEIIQGKSGVDLAALFGD
jgi:hypothetical protein